MQWCDGFGCHRHLLKMARTGEADSVLVGCVVTKCFAHDGVCPGVSGPGTEGDP